MTKKAGNSLQAILNRASAEAVTADVAPGSIASDAEHARPAPPSGRSRQGNPGRAGTKMIGGHFAPEISTQLRILAVEEGTTVQALLEEAISDLLTKKAGRKVRR